MSNDLSLSATAVMAATEGNLVDASYRPVPIEKLPDDWPADARAYEDAYGIVGVFVYETAAGLLENWRVAQQHLVDLISEFIHRDEAKAWDGYLVLLTPSVAPPDLAALAIQVRQDTTYVRKLVAAGGELGSLSGVQRTLLPILPIETETRAAPTASALSRLPELLARHGLPLHITQLVLEAADEQKSLLRALEEAGET